MLISSNPQKFFLARFNAKSHDSFFIWVVMFNLTIFWVRENSVFPFPNTEILLILEEELFVELSTTISFTEAFCLSGAALVPFAQLIISVNVPPGHQSDRKMLENSISVCKTFVAFSNINIISLNC